MKIVDVQVPVFEKSDTFKYVDINLNDNFIYCI